MKNKSRNNHVRKTGRKEINNNRIIHTRVLLLVVTIMLSNNVSAQYRIDTLYYDNKWDIVPIREFADYYRIAFYDETNPQRNKCRDFYMTGELQGESGFMSLGLQNDSTSVWNGQSVTYYKNGNKKTEAYYDKGILNGRMITYYDNGLIHQNLNFVDGKLDGILTIFGDNDVFYQHEYSQGKPTLSYYIYGDALGHRMKIDYSSDSIICETPMERDRKTVYRDGAEWQWYDANGLVVAATAILDGGIFAKIYITNYSGETIMIDVDNITGSIANKKGKYETPLKTITYEKFQRNRATTAFLLAAAAYATESMATSNAGTQISTSHTAYLGSYGNALYGGSSYTSTRSYDASAAYQSRILAEQKVSSFSNSVWNELMAKSVGYLKKNTIYSGQTISGHVSLVPKKGNSINMKGWIVHLVVDLNGAKYVFDLPLISPSGI